MLAEKCEVCGSTELEQTSTRVGTLIRCVSCNSTFCHYYRRDAKPFTYPAAWGRCLGVLDHSELLRPVENLAEDEDEAEVGIRPEPTYSIYGDIYYIFADDDGTIRRARIGYGEFAPTGTRPDTIPEDVPVFHYWTIDVLSRES